MNWQHPSGPIRLYLLVQKIWLLRWPKKNLWQIQLKPPIKSNSTKFNSMKKPDTPFTSSSIHPNQWDFVSQTRRSRSQTQRAVALSWLGGARRAPRLWGGWGVEGASSLVETYHNLRKSWRFNLPNPPICYSSGWFCIMESWPHAFFCNKNELQFARHVFLWGEMVSINYQLRICENVQEMSRLESRLSFPNLIHR